VKHEIFITHTAYEYQETVKRLQDQGWNIAMVQYIVGPQPSWVITGQIEKQAPADHD